MKFKVIKSSDYVYDETVEITSLKALVEFVKKEGEIILDCGVDGATIEIYDDYRE